jgi:hypothetical protein
MLTTTIPHLRYHKQMAAGESRVLYEVVKADPSRADWGVAPLKWDWHQNDSIAHIRERSSSSSNTHSDSSSPAIEVNGNDVMDTAMDTGDALLHHDNDTTAHSNSSGSGSAAAVSTASGKYSTVHTTLVLTDNLFS